MRTYGGYDRVDGFTGLGGLRRRGTMTRQTTWRRRLLVVALSLGLAAGALATWAPTATVADAAQPAATTWSVSAAPFALTFRHGHRVIAQEAPGNIDGPGGRLVYQAGGSADSQAGATWHRVTDLMSTRRIAGGDEYTVATDEPGRTATVRVVRTRSGARVQWQLTSSDRAAAPVTVVLDALSARSTEHYLSGSSAAYVELRGHIRGWSPGKEGHEAGAYCQNQEQTASPFYLSSGGYGVNVETSHIGRFAFPGATPIADDPSCDTPGVPKGDPVPYACPLSPTAYADRVQICLKDSSLDYDVFAGSPAQVTTDYYRTVGLPSLPPPSEFGLIKWRDVNADQQQVLADVAQFRQLGIPLSTIFIDNPWEQQPPGNLVRANGSACNGTLSFDPTFFPDPSAMIDTIHRQGVKFGLWVSPISSTPSASKGGGSCAGLNNVWADNGWLIPGTNYIDFTIPAARAYYIDKLTRLFRLGVDMTKEDRGEEYRLETATLHGGSGASLYLKYPDLYESAVSAALRAVNGNDFETLVRAGVPGTAQHTHGMWGSDTTQTFAGLRAELRYGITESLTGHFAWGSDTGGIDPLKPADATNSPTPTLFTRWAQFSAVSPVFEVGGAGLNATPWAYPADTVARFRDAVRLHYELFPYLYGLARQAAATGVPIMRSVGFQYPDDQAAWAQDQEFMVGPDLLAAPVTGDNAEADGAAGRSTPVPVYLPRGRWIDLYAGTVVDGGRTITRPTSLDEFPLYLRAGSSIGFNARTPDVWADGWGPNDLSHPGLSGWMYAPGSSRAAAGDGTSAGAFTAATAHGVVSLHLNRATPRTQVLVLTHARPKRVIVDGRVLPAAAAPANLRAAHEGWTMSDGPFGGVVLKLTPKHGQSSARIEFASAP
jgi:alpha-glucosidase (family GH31 glycosyl hydrolase)